MLRYFYMKNTLIGFLLVIIAFGAPVAAGAQNKELPEPTDAFRMSGEVHAPSEGVRDLIAFGGVVDTRNSVGKDVIAVGGTVRISAPVLGDVRALGRTVIIDAPVSGNVAAWGSEISITENGSVGGSVVAGGEHVSIKGVVAGNAQLYANTLSLDGSFGSDVNATAPNIALGSSASIVGNFDYKSTSEAAVPDGVVGGKALYTGYATPRSANPFLAIVRLISLFGMLVVGLVLVTFIPKTMRAIGERTMRSPAKDAAWGAGVFLLTPIAVVILALTIIGMPLAFITLMGYGIALYIAHVIVGIVLGTYIIGAVKGRTYAGKAPLTLVMIIGVTVLWLIKSIPFIGALVALVSMVWGLGMIVRLKTNVLSIMEK